MIVLRFIRIFLLWAGALFGAFDCAFAQQNELPFQSESSQKVDFFQMSREGRIHNRDGLTGLRINLRDSDIYSPKSVIFAADGKKFYIHSLEGGKTVVYSYPEFKKLKTISHRFDANREKLFNGETTIFDYPYYQDISDEEKNIFTGKPVESALSHNGKYLWVTYYRRSYDEYAQSPSAVAIIDTSTDTIVRVMPTGPIPKYVAISPDNRTAAIVHWGDNTIGLMDISSNDAQDFHYISHVIIGHQLSLEGLEGTNRDSTCGGCLRGSVFTLDNKTLLVAKMSSGGGIAGVDVETGRYLGTLTGFAATPRHLVLDSSGEFLYVSSNNAGVVSRVYTDDVVAELRKANGRVVGFQSRRIQKVDLGSGARTIDITPDGRTLFVALNSSQVLSAIDAETLTPLGEIPVDPYPVGLAVSPDGRVVLVTAQGVQGRGGNSVNIITFDRKSFEPPAENKPR